MKKYLRQETVNQTTVYTYNMSSCLCIPCMHVQSTVIKEIRCKGALELDLHMVEVRYLLQVVHSGFGFQLALVSPVLYSPLY